MRKLLFTFIIALLLTIAADAQWRPWPTERKQLEQRSVATVTDIYPASIRIFPKDVQTFTVRSVPPPVIWRTFTNVTLEPDQTLERITSGLFGALIEPRVHSGIAGVLWTITPDMIPSTGGTIQFQLFGVGTRLPTHMLRVEAGPTSTVVKDETGSTIDTVSHTIAGGDTYYLEVSGNIFRLAINGVTETIYEVTSPTEYPIRATVFGDNSFVSSPAIITPPTFTGAWNLVASDTSDTNWTAEGGTLDDSTDTWQVQYTAGDMPGIYQIAAEIGDEPQQTFYATVIIEPLSVLGLTDITLQPGQKYTIPTNYDSAQSKIVTWSVASGGGSFTGSEYTAATAPGDSVLVAAYGDQEVSVTVHVPVVMEIENPASVAVTAAKLGEVLTLSTNIASGTITWSADRGVITGSPGATVTWTAPNQRLDGDQAPIITVTNSTVTLTQVIPVLKHFAYDPTQPSTWERIKDVLVSKAEDRSRSSRVKSYNNQAYEAYEFQFVNRGLAEATAVEDFSDEHYPQLRFIYEDKYRTRRKVVYLDSPIKTQAYARCAFIYSLRLIEG